MGSPEPGADILMMGGAGMGTIRVPIDSFWVLRSSARFVLDKISGPMAICAVAITVSDWGTRVKKERSVLWTRGGGWQRKVEEKDLRVGVEEVHNDKPDIRARAPWSNSNLQRCRGGCVSAYAGAYLLSQCANNTKQLSRQARRFLLFRRLRDRGR